MKAYPQCYTRTSPKAYKDYNGKTQASTTLLDDGQLVLIDGTNLLFENYYSLIDNYDNYDMLELFYHSSSDHNNTGEMSSSLFTVAELKENNVRTFYGYGTRYIGIVFDKENTKQFRIAFNGVTGEASDKKWLLYKIVGIKFSGGSSSPGGDSIESSQKILAIDTLYSEEEYQTAQISSLNK